MRYLTEVIVESETDGLDAANCKTRCMSQECPYYWEGFAPGRSKSIRRRSQGAVYTDFGRF